MRSRQLNQIRVAPLIFPHLAIFVAKERGRRWMGSLLESEILEILTRDAIPSRYCPLRVYPKVCEAERVRRLWSVIISMSVVRAHGTRCGRASSSGLASSLFLGLPGSPDPRAEHCLTPLRD